MKRILTILVLLAHINFAMFVPQVDEDNGMPGICRVANSNTVGDYLKAIIYEDLSGNEDPDDDNPRFYYVQQVNKYSFTQNITELKTAGFNCAALTKYPCYISKSIEKGFQNLHAPPPKA